MLATSSVPRRYSRKPPIRCIPSAAKSLADANTSLRISPTGPACRLFSAGPIVHSAALSLFHKWCGWTFAVSGSAGLLTVRNRPPPSESVGDDEAEIGDVCIDTIDSDAELVVDPFWVKMLVTSDPEKLRAALVGFLAFLSSPGEERGNMVFSFSFPNPFS